MATLTLPVRTDVPYYDFDVDLEDRSFTLELRWNDRAGAWFLSVYDSAGAPLVSGRRVVLGSPLLGHGVSSALPPGDLLAIDTTDAGTDPGRDDFGTRVVLAYVESVG